MSPRAAQVRIYVDADVLGLGKILASLRSDGSVRAAPDKLQSLSVIGTLDHRFPADYERKITQHPADTATRRSPSSAAGVNKGPSVVVPEVSLAARSTGTCSVAVGNKHLIVAVAVHDAHPALPWRRRDARCRSVPLVRR